MRNPTTPDFGIKIQRFVFLINLVVLLTNGDADTRNLTPETKKYQKSQMQTNYPVVWFK